MFHYPQNKKYFTETKIFIKIKIVFKNLFQSVREKIRIEKVVHEKFKLNVVNQNNCKILVEQCVRKVLSCVGEKIKYENVVHEKFKLNVVN